VETVKNFDNVKELQQFIPTEQDAQSFDVVSCLKVLSYYKPKDEFAGMLGKVCYVTKKRLELELRVEESKPEESKGRPFGSPLVAVGGLTLLTTLRVKVMLEHQSFLIKDRTHTGNGMMRFVAERMPEVDWDEMQPLWKYPENVVVNTPLYYPQYLYIYNRINGHGINWGKWNKIDRLIRDFKIWMFAPIYYCITCGKHHQGSHRLAVARELGMPTIRVRIIRHWWERNIQEPMQLEYYLEKLGSREQSSALKPYEKHDERVMKLKHLTKPSKVYQEYLEAKKRGIVK